MLRIRRVAPVLAFVGMGWPAAAQTTSDAQTTPYSKDLTQPTTKSPTQSPGTQPAPPPPVQNITVQPAPNVTLLPPAQPVVEQHPVNVTVIEAARPAPLMSVSLGGGISEFVESQVRDRTGVNGEYELRLVFGVSSPLAFELAYVGTAVGIEGLAGENNATLLSNGVEGLARVNFTRGPVQPFVVGGASWVHYSVVDARVSLSDVRDSDNVLALPFGGGLAGYVPDTGLVIDARFIYRATFYDDLLRPMVGSGSGAGLGNWSVSLRVGYAF
jgi:hypothetical protein